MPGKLINIDNGGTLTDICVIDGDKVFHTKTVTTPYDLTKCFFDGLKKASKVIYGEERLTTLLNETECIRYSTTQGTNALVERKGPRLGLILQKGAQGVSGELMERLVGERVRHVDTASDEATFDRDVVQAINSLAASGASRLVVAIDGDGYQAVENRFKAVFLSRFHRHKLGAIPALFSHEVSGDRDYGRRLWTALFNSFLHPSTERFLYGAQHILQSHKFRVPLLIFRNDGLSARIAKTIAIKTYSSGPQGGVEGARAFATRYKLPSVVTMDIGGTTTDVALIKDAQERIKRRGEIEGQNISFPLGDIHSAGVGGSSIIRVDGGAIRVGPESVGGVPGPACFGRGGTEATITDALVLAGVLDPQSFFAGDLTLDAERARAVIDERICRPLGCDLETALGRMEQAWVAKVADSLGGHGKLPADTTLLAFGGAGTMAISAIAEKAGLTKVAIPKNAAVFSAFGIGFSDIGQVYETALTGNSDTALQDAAKHLLSQAGRDMFAEGYAIDDCQSSFSLSVERGSEEQTLALSETAALPANISPSAVLSLILRVVKPIAHASFVAAAKPAKAAAKAAGTRRVQDSGGWQELPLYRLEDQTPGAAAAGPAILEDPYFTCRIGRGWTFTISENGDIFMDSQP